MPRAKVKLNSAGVKELLGSKGVAAELERLAERAAATVPGAKVRVVTTGGYRAVADVYDDRPGALAREAKSGALARSLQAVPRNG